MAIKYAENGTATVSSLDDVKIAAHTYYTVEGLDFFPGARFDNEYSAEDAVRDALLFYGYPEMEARQVAEGRRRDAQRREIDKLAGTN